MTKRRKYTVTLRLTHPEMVMLKGLQVVMQAPTMQEMILRTSEAMTQAIIARNSHYAQQATAATADVADTPDATPTAGT